MPFDIHDRHNILILQNFSFSYWLLLGFLHLQFFLARDVNVLDCGPIKKGFKRIVIVFLRYDQKNIMAYSIITMKFCNLVRFPLGDFLCELNYD